MSISNFKNQLNSNDLDINFTQVDILSHPYSGNYRPTSFPTPGLIIDADSLAALEAESLRLDSACQLLSELD